MTQVDLAMLKEFDEVRDSISPVEVFPRHAYVDGVRSWRYQFLYDGASLHMTPTRDLLTEAVADAMAYCHELRESQDGAITEWDQDAL